MRIATFALLSGFVLVFAGPAFAALQHKTVEYKVEGKTFKGYLVWDDAVTGKRPGIVVYPEWWGINAYSKKRADMLAELGYVAFAADPYGDGKSTNEPKESGAWAGALKKDVKEWNARAMAAIKVLEEDPNVDATKLGAIGYCFGGSTCLLLAYNGAPLKAVASFHGGMVVPTDAEAAAAAKTKILSCTGADDTGIPAEKIQEVKSKLDAAKVDSKFIVYPGVVHSFTNPTADSHGMKNMRYDAASDKASWGEMQKLFSATFGK
jgi:dienelactone hydrolase